MLKEHILKHQNSSPTPINNALDQLIKGTETMMHSAVLLKSEVQALWKANEETNRCRRRKKKRIQKGETLTVQESQDLLNEEAVDAQINEKTRQGGGLSRDTTGRKRCCGNCRKAGHNSRTCQMDQQITIEERID